MTDAEGGHGTFGAGVVAGSGRASGDFFGGLAPGAKLIGLVAGNDLGLSTFAILQAYDYALVNQFRYNIRLCNNSFGATLAELPYDPFDPINVATRMMHDRNIVVVFAAGNGGDVPNAINPLSVAPWVISVAAGQKQGFGAPAPFSSRGNDNGTGVDVAGQPADPMAPPNLRPDITGPGVDIKSVRSKGPGLTNLLGTPIDVATIPPAFLPFYTTSSGTSFAAPSYCGAAALVLEANPFPIGSNVVDIAGRADRAEIERALLRRLMDSFSDGTFRPDLDVTRQDLARTMALSGAVRQNLFDSPRFSDVTADLAPIASAVAARGSVLKDTFQRFPGIMSRKASGTNFFPLATVDRADLAVTLVRALGLEQQAQARMNEDLSSKVIDASEIPADARGFVAVALDLGLLEAFRGHTGAAL